MLYYEKVIAGTLNLELVLPQLSTRKMQKLTFTMIMFSASGSKKLGMAFLPNLLNLIQLSRCYFIDPFVFVVVNV